MSVVDGQELQIVQAFSSTDLPEKIFRESKIGELIRSITTAQGEVQSDAQRLEYLRQEQKDGNFVSNWWNDRDDKVQDAQIGLNKSIGRLTQKSSQLLVVNTAISKVLCDQQRILLEQQNLLKLQADQLEGQNRKILDQQDQLARQQREINAANQGLMEAKGITQEQAQKLVGCVLRVTEAENKIGIAQKELRATLEQHMDNMIAQYAGRMDEGFAELDKRYGALALELNNAFSAHSRQTHDELQCFASRSGEFEASVEHQLHERMQAILEKMALQDAAAHQLRNTVKGLELRLESAQQEHRQEFDAEREFRDRSHQHLANDLNSRAEELEGLASRLTSLRAEQQKSARRNRLIFGVVGCLTLVSLGWQIAQNFTVI